MIFLESINVVQFFLFEKERVTLKEITGVFGPNGSGKSSLLDAAQIAMFGANSRLLALNAQADDNKTTRSIRSYCLGQYGERADNVVRQHATTYITLVWRNSVTNAPTSMGVCIYASADRETHDVLGRYLLRDVELTLGDHLETIDGAERPRDWKTFRHQLVEHSKVTGDDAVFKDAERYIRACLLALRGSGGPPSFEPFVRAFRFALRMKFDKSVDEIVRDDVLEDRPTNIKKFKEVTESFRRLDEMVKYVEDKIKDGEAIESRFGAAAKYSSRDTTLKVLGLDVAAEIANDKSEQTEKERTKAVNILQQLGKKHNELKSKYAEAKSERERYLRLRQQHESHADYAGLQSQIRAEESRAGKKLDSIWDVVKSLQAVLRVSLESEFMDQHTADIESALEFLNEITSKAESIQWDWLENNLKPVLGTIEGIFKTVQSLHGQIDSRLKEARADFDNALAAQHRVDNGKKPLSDNVQRLVTELSNNGVTSIPVCDLVTIESEEWQPVIESYLGRNLQALMVDEGHERHAFKVYRALDGQQAIYGAKVVMRDRQSVGRRYSDGSVAALIQGKDAAAVEFLRNLFGDMQRARSNDEAMMGTRTLTSDGMLVKRGVFDRIEPVKKEDLRIGRGEKKYRNTISDMVKACKKNVSELERKRKALDSLFATLRTVPEESEVLKNTKSLLNERDAALGNMESLTEKMQGAADAEYIRLGDQEKYWENEENKLRTSVEENARTLGTAEADLKKLKSNADAAIREVETAKTLAAERRSDTDYDQDYANSQWDYFWDKAGGELSEMADQCNKRQVDMADRANKESIHGVRLLGEFLVKHKEHLGSDAQADWRKSKVWISEVLHRLRATELVDYKEQMGEAYRISQQTFRNDVAIALNNNIEALERTINRLNEVLKTCPPFTNGERYEFKHTLRKDLEPLLRFIKNIAAYGPHDDLLGGAGDIPEQFKELLEEKVAPGASSVRSPLDDYREFFEFDIEIYRSDPVSQDDAAKKRVVGHLSKRLGPGSGGEHRAPLYVIAGAALASAYRLESGNMDGMRLILLDEAFNKMDHTNILTTMKYLEDLGLQVFMASPGENLGVLTAFLHRYYDIMRDADLNAIYLDGHDVGKDVRELFRSDQPEFHSELIEQEVVQMRKERSMATTSESK